MDENIRNTEGPSCPQPEPEENALHMALEHAPAEALRKSAGGDLPIRKYSLPGSRQGVGFL